MRTPVNYLLFKLAGFDATLSGWFDQPRTICLSPMHQRVAAPDFPVYNAATLSHSNVMFTGDDAMLHIRYSLT